MQSATYFVDGERIRVDREPGGWIIEGRKYSEAYVMRRGDGRVHGIYPTAQLATSAVIRISNGGS
jgi:hypothetical protein